MPVMPPALDKTTIRPRPAARMEGNSAFVSATGPKRFVEKICSHTLTGTSSTEPAAAIPALCTTTSGAPTCSLTALAASAIDWGSSRSSRTPSNRGSLSPAPVAARRRSSPTSGERIAATTRHPCLYRRVADARPSPRDAPVMTTLRDSCTAAPTVSAFVGWCHVRTSRRLATHPGVPVPLEVGAGLPFSFIESVGIVDLGFRKRPGARDGGGELRRADGGEAGAINEIGDVQYDSHHQECGEGGPGGKPTQPLRELLGLRASRVVPMAEDACGNHHHRDERGLHDQRELEGRSGKHRAPRSDLRVDVQPGVDEEDLEERVHDEPDDEEQQRQADERATPDERLGGRMHLKTAQDPAPREEGADEVEGRVSDHDEGLDGGRQLQQGTVFGKVPEMGVVDGVRCQV